MRKSLLTIGNPKTMKGEARGYITAVLHLAPANEAGHGTVCAKATPGCMATCLNTAGRGGIGLTTRGTNAVQEARRRRTAFYKLHRTAFEAALSEDISKFVRMAERKGLTPCVRVNGTSDLRGLALAMAAQFPTVQFYDYTKLPLTHGRMPLPNYHLTFSRSEHNANDVVDALESGVNVAVVFSTARGKALPRYAYAGGRRYDVIDGDESDLRFMDPHGTRGIVIGLRAKGRARKDSSGFVVNVHATQHVA